MSIVVGGGGAPLSCVNLFDNDDDDDVVRLDNCGGSRVDRTDDWKPET